jgi:hypothetical protein
MVTSEMFSSIEPYFKYRHSTGATDHGIYAGLLHFDLLVENRIYQKSRPENRWDWEDYLDEQYTYAAAIAAHNIWLPEEKDEEKYRNNGLGPLIGKKSITFAEGPLLFFWGLVDTLDPVKAYSCLSVKFVLKNVTLDFPDSNSFRLTISPELNPDILIEKAKAARKWLNMEVALDNMSITVQIGASEPADHPFSRC